MSENSRTRTQSVLNRASAKAYALKVSKERRAGKFTRVSEEFLEAVEADLESAIRRISVACVNEPVAPDEGASFVTKLARGKAEEKLEELARAIIQSKVQRHPSLGTTLKTV